MAMLVMINYMMVCTMFPAAVVRGAERDQRELCYQCYGAECLTGTGDPPLLWCRTRGAPWLSASNGSRRWLLSNRRLRPRYRQWLSLNATLAVGCCG
jgi:hypothetical protein